jgi:hypothetical protein
LFNDSKKQSVYKLLPLGYTQQQTKSFYAGTVFYSCLKKKEGSISCCRQDYFFSQTLSKLKNTSLSNVRNMKMLKKN